MKKLQIRLFTQEDAKKKHEQDRLANLKKHKKIRFATATRMRHHGMEYWENYLITDEKIGLYTDTLIHRMIGSEQNPKKTWNEDKEKEYFILVEQKYLTNIEKKIKITVIICR